MLALEGIKIHDILPLWPELAEVSPNIHSQLEADYRYAGYIGRQQADIDALRRDEGINSKKTDFASVGGYQLSQKIY